MPTDLSAHATLLRHAIARFVELRIDGLVCSAASGSRALTWALRHLVEEIRTEPPSGDHAPPAAAWPDEENDDGSRTSHRHPRRTAMIAQDHQTRIGHIRRHGHPTHGRLPTWQRQHVPVHGARTGPRDPNALDGHRVQHGRRGGR